MMSRKSQWDYFKAIYQRYRKASKSLKQQILNEFCQVCGYHRKHAIRLLKGLPPGKPKPRIRTRSVTYGSQVILILAAIWEAASYPGSIRLKALLPLWLPWVTDSLERQILRISPATMDRRLKIRKRLLTKKIYGRTKPGTLLKHHIPLKCACPQADAYKVAPLKKLLESLNPFELSKSLDQKLECIYRMAHARRTPMASSTQTKNQKTDKPLTRIEKETLQTLSEAFGITAYVKTGTTKHPNI